MAQNKKGSEVVSQTISNMDLSTDSEESGFDVPIPVVQPKASASTSTPKGKGSKGKKKKTSTSGASGEYDLVFDDIQTARPKDNITNKCKIGERIHSFTNILFENIHKDLTELVSVIIKLLFSSNIKIKIINLSSQITSFE